MPTGKKYCWDSCVFISLLTGEGRTDEEVDNLRSLERLCDDGEIYIFTPSITLVEVLACKFTPEQEALFQAMLKRSNLEVTSVSRRVAEIAREIRNHYRSNDVEIAVSDSIHLATAIHFKASALHTFDGCGKRPKRTDLLNLSAPIIGKYDLTICKPEPPPKSEAVSKPETSELMTPSLFDFSEQSATDDEISAG